MKNKTYVLMTTDREIPIELQYGYRKRLTLTVYPDRKIIARIPFGFSKKNLEAYFQKKTNWMIKHLDHFEKFPPESEKNYVNGETFDYLGKVFLLRLEQGITKITLIDNMLILRIRDPEDLEMKQKAMTRWYKNEAIMVMTPLFEQWFENLQYLDLPKTTLRFYKMKRRWGSCSSKHVITLNTELIKKDLKLIDYVIVHEICHLKIPAHNKDFYSLLASVLPEWKELRSKLNNRD